MIRRSLSVLAVVFLAGVLVAAAGTVALSRDHAAAAGPGNSGMMGNGGAMIGGGGMMGGAFGATVQTSVTSAQLQMVRERVEKRLAASGYKGFSVGEIMAFTNNDYVLVDAAAGKPAFELLADPKGRWLMPEPTTMMWNTRYGMVRLFGGAAHGGWPGMMGGFGSGSGGPVSTAAAAKTRADAWLAQRRPGEQTADATALPGYFTIDVVKDAKKVGMLSVNAKTGAVWFHGWHGGFLADQDF